MKSILFSLILMSLSVAFAETDSPEPLTSYVDVSDQFDRLQLEERMDAFEERVRVAVERAQLNVDGADIVIETTENRGLEGFLTYSDGRICKFVQGYSYGFTKYSYFGLGNYDNPKKDHFECVNP